MAGTLAHDASVLLVGGGLVAFGLYQSVPELMYISGGVVFGGIWLSPDLDWGPGVLVNGEVLAYDHSFVTRELHNKRLVWGKITRRWLAFAFWWKLFAFLFQHRGICHYPFAGLLVRALWIAPLSFALTYLLWPDSILIWGGMVVADMLHIGLDGGVRPK